MALLRRSKTPGPAAPPPAQLVLLTFPALRTKREQDSLEGLQALTATRLERLGLGTAEAHTVPGGGTELRLVGPDSALMWSAVEQAVRLCPALPLEVEMRAGGVGAASARTGALEPSETALRPRLELQPPAGPPVRRATAFDVLHHLELLPDGEELVLAEHGGEPSIACVREDGWWVQLREGGRGRTRSVTDLEAALAALLAWGEPTA